MTPTNMEMIYQVFLDLSVRKVELVAYSAWLRTWAELKLETLSMVFMIENVFPKN